MEEKVNIWKANLTNGVIMALVVIAFSLVLYFFDLTFNKTVGYINIPLRLVVLYFLLKTFRDTVMHGQITYGQSIGAGMVIFTYVAIITAVYTYLLWAVIDPGLAKKSLAFTEEAMVKKGTPQSAIDAGMAFTAKIMKPGIMALAAIFTTLFGGIIYSLLVSIFIRNEGNPLVDAPAN